MEVGKSGVTDPRPVYIAWRGDLENRSWGVHIDGVGGNGKAKIGKMDAIVRHSHPGTRIKRCVLIMVIVPEPQHAEVWEGSAVFVTWLEAARMTAAKKNFDVGAVLS